MAGKKFIGLIAPGIIFILIIFSNSSFAIIHSQLGEVELSYKNFTYNSSDICTKDNNWCGKVEFTEKAIVYGSIETEVSVPEGTKDVYVWIHLSCNSLGEGLYGQAGSVALISVDNESKPETIRSTHNRHHGSYYKYDYCESFLNSFNVFGSKIKLKIEMIAEARMDLEKIVLKFYNGEIEDEKEGENLTGNGSLNESVNESVNESMAITGESENYSLNYSPVKDSDNDSFPDPEDNCPWIKGPECNSGCPAKTDIDCDGLQEDNKNCPGYDKNPYDYDNDGIPTIEDCDDLDRENTKTKGDDDLDDVSNCLDRCPGEKGKDLYGCPKVVDVKEIPDGIDRNIVIFAAASVIILILIILLVKKVKKS